MRDGARRCTPGAECSLSSLQSYISGQSRKAIARARGGGRGGGGVRGDLEPQRIDAFAGGREDRQ